MAGRKCALCSACGSAFHPQCLEPPFQHRPPGSTPSALHGKNTWVCFHCECALPVVVAPGEDDPIAMATGKWSSKEFDKKSFKEGLRVFWKKEHSMAVAENEELLESRRLKLEAEKEKVEKEVRQARTQGGWGGGGVQRVRRRQQR